MAGMFWNSRGVGEDIRKNFIRTAIVSNKLHFIGLQETKKSSFTNVELERLSGGQDFTWIIAPSIGQGGGMMLGINNSALKVINSECGKFYIKVEVQNVSGGVNWSIVNIYGAPHNRDKEEFLVELVHIFHNRSGLPLIVGGDFNLIRKGSECNKEIVLNRWCKLFNAVIENWELKEIETPGRRFTWSNNQQDPTMKKLDRVLISLDWEHLFPLVTLRLLTRELSDHAPIVVDLGLNRPKVEKPFKFELCWFLREDLADVVKKVWDSSFLGNNTASRWQNRFRKLRKTLKGWNLNYVWFYKKQKKVLVDAIDAIDRESEVVGLSSEKYNTRKELDAKLRKIYKEEEVMWFQRAKEKRNP